MKNTMMRRFALSIKFSPPGICLGGFFNGASVAFISFKQMAEAVREDLKSEFREKLPFACVVALTRTAVKCRDAMKVHMQKAFDRPTPYALNAARAVPATKANMASGVLLREFGGKGTPAEYFLGPEIDGGVRRQKREEKAFSAKGYLEPGGYLTPGSAAAMNAFGNEQAAEIVKIMSILRAFGEQGYRANRAKTWNKKTRAGQIFVVRQGNNKAGLKPGVYRRVNAGVGEDKVECIQIFVKKKPTYRVRLPFDKLVETDASRIFPAELHAAMEQFS